MRPSVPACLALVSLLLLPAAAGAQEDGGAAVTGAGFGHGVGMSQYGARSMAEKDFSAQQIVQHYYTGVEVEYRDVGAEGSTDLQVGLTNGQDTWVLDNDPDSQDDLDVEFVADGTDTRLAVPPGASLHVDQVDGTDCELRVVAEDEDRPDEADTTTACDDLEVRWPIDPQGPATFVHLDRDSAHDLVLARGWIDYVQADDETVHTVLQIHMEDYLYGLAEVPSSWPSASLQAQVLAGRTFALRRVANPRGAACSCDLLTTTADQHYTGWTKEDEGQWGHIWVAAVDDTNNDDRTQGRVITHEGTLVNAVYSSSSPGTTEDSRDIWGGDVAYLRPADDHYAHDEDANNSLSSWTREFGYADFSTRLGFDEVHAIELVEDLRLRSGNPGVYRVTGEKDGQEVTEDLHTYRDLRRMLSLPSHGVFEVDLQLPELFEDVAVDHPFHDEIAWMVDEELTDGYQDGTFQPGQTVSRQAAAAFLYRLAGEPAGDHTTDFSDVDQDHPFHDAIAWADQEGIVEGYDDGTFGPGREVTRQAIAAFLARYEFGEDVPEGDTANFSDVDADHPFHDEIAWMDGEGIAEGYDDGTYKPGRAVARQAAAAFLHRYGTSS